MKLRHVSLRWHIKNNIKEQWSKLKAETNLGKKEKHNLVKTVINSCKFLYFSICITIIKTGIFVQHYNWSVSHKKPEHKGWQRG